MYGNGGYSGGHRKANTIPEKLPSGSGNSKIVSARRQTKATIVCKTCSSKKMKYCT